MGSFKSKGRDHGHNRRRGRTGSGRQGFPRIESLEERRLLDVVLRLRELDVLGGAEVVVGWPRHAASSPRPPPVIANPISSSVALGGNSPTICPS